jgi:hypothetical protein
MKRIRIIQATALFLLLGIGFPIHARQGQPDKQEEKAKPGKPERQANPERKQDKPEKQEQPQQAKEPQDQQRQQRDNAAKQQQAKNQQQEQQQDKQQDKANRHEQQIAKGQQDQQRHQQQERQDQASQRQEQARSHQDQQRQQVAWQDDRARSWKSEHRTWQQRGGYQGYRVPDDRFRSYYGQDHGFRIYSLPVRYVGGHRQFQYGGYWFGLIDPWPEYWSSDWYDSDDVYVDYYDDGYYLYNRRYPGDRISISFYLN